MPKKKTKRRRERGAASLPCPRCGETSEVLRTTRMNGSLVQRHRQCKTCEHRFWSHEEPVQEVA